MTNNDRNLCARVHPHFTGFCYLSKSAEPVCTPQVYTSPHYLRFTDYNPSAFVILTFFSLTSRSFTPHMPLFHTLLWLFQAHNVSSHVLLLVLTWVLFDLQRTFITALYAAGKCQRITRDQRAAASPCWIPQSHMEPLQRLYVEGLSYRTQTFTGGKCWVFLSKTLHSKKVKLQKCSAYVFLLAFCICLYVLFLYLQIHWDEEYFLFFVCERTGDKCCLLLRLSGECQALFVYVCVMCWYLT